MASSSSSAVNTCTDKRSEEDPFQDSGLFNSTVENFSWSGVSVQVKDKKTKELRTIVDNAAGIVQAGDICALMGPSGCGKTTLLNVLAGRPSQAAKTTATVRVNGLEYPASEFRSLSSFVEQDDVLMSSLTVRETIDFSARLSGLGSSLDRRRRIDALLSAMGLTDQADNLIGTPLRRGISGGQKRRVSVASQLITGPAVIFLDEPTTSLDSLASFEVISHLRAVARRNKLIIILSIHQPSAVTFRLFDKLMLLSAGKTHYFGSLDALHGYYTEVGARIPEHVNPADHLLETLNIDFSTDKSAASRHLDQLQQAWKASRLADDVTTGINAARRSPYHASNKPPGSHSHNPRPNRLSVLYILCHRGFIKGYRDHMTYGLRLVMFFVLALMLGTIWIRLDPNQDSVHPRLMLLFIQTGFTSFVAVCYVPAYLEDRHLFKKEYYDALCGATEMLISNFLVGLPFLLLMCLSFCPIVYWLANFQPTASGTFMYITWIYLDMLAAESAVVFFASLFPSFVAALVAFCTLNSLFMSICVVIVPSSMLNGFYKYVFRSWDYINYVFQGLVINEFKDRDYSGVSGQIVLDRFEFRANDTPRIVGYLLAITAAFRLGAWLALRFS
ncbi:hypothetical protein GQ602_000394 [Ophiocordyceps camponoti-floridani]|uniref:ABC transporter domain-containing protein n=1 Tax=Ophiocordyceps camponoti-floridani TaxID=2030778 RepID=A0A8H4VGF9_9HYPO|nr:hypothetical protein GQ602_000394 [Ophiocordyceps camponoti-floridani]